MALTWTIIWWCLLLVILVNEIAAIYTVFREKRDIAATWAWLLVLTLIPGFGFILYAFFGRKLPHKQLARIKSQTQLKLKQALERQKQQFINMPKPKDQTVQIYRRTVMLFQSIDDWRLNRAIYWYCELTPGMVGLLIVSLIRLFHLSSQRRKMKRFIIV